jgi:trehalose synthase
VESSRECADACLEILADPQAARRMALQGKEYVRTHFLMPRLVRDWLALFNRLDGRDTGDTQLATVGEAA